jgi:hypothetical protein
MNIVYGKRPDVKILKHMVQKMVLLKIDSWDESNQSNSNNAQCLAASHQKIDLFKISSGREKKRTYRHMYQMKKNPSRSKVNVALAMFANI